MSEIEALRQKLARAEKRCAAWARYARVQSQFAFEADLELGMLIDEGIHHAIRRGLTTGRFTHMVAEELEKRGHDISRDILQDAIVAAQKRVLRPVPLTPHSDS